MFPYTVLFLLDLYLSSFDEFHKSKQKWKNVSIGHRCKSRGITQKTEK